jgi:hypothetical protein
MATAPPKPSVTPAEPRATAGEPPDQPHRRAALYARAEERNAAARAQLVPLGAGERPWPITVSAALATALGAGNLIAFVAGAKIGGKHPAVGGILVFSALMFAAAYGLWRMRYWAVLGFMALLALTAALFALLLTEASNLLGFLVPPFIIAGAGYLFWKLVRVLSRIQMPAYPRR